METIVKLWFADGRIYILTSQGNTYSRPLEAFPLLLEATPQQRAHYEIGIDGDDIRWDDIDEDIHISSFFVSAALDGKSGTTHYHLRQCPDGRNRDSDLFHRSPHPLRHQDKVYAA